MHQSIVRRFPAVRARHVKRMPPAILDSDDAPSLNFTLTGPVTITQVMIVPAPTATTTVPRSLSASPTSIFDSLSSPSESTTTVTTTTTNTDINPTVSPTPTPAETAVDSAPVPSNLASNLAKKSVSSGAIAGIVVVVVLAVLGLAFFFTRKRFISNRKRRRPAWGSPIMNMPDASREVDRGHVFPHQQEPPRVTLPPMSYNNLTSTMAIVEKGMTDYGSSSPLLQNAATVKSTFIPTLPDELSLTLGETLRVLNEYDDGWASCANRLGEQGMVPLDCLDREMQDYRLSKRASSLAPKRY